MKKGLIVAFFALLGVTQVMSQVSFRPGIRGGLNFSHFTKGDNSNGGYYDNNGNYVSNSPGSMIHKQHTILVFMGLYILQNIILYNLKLIIQNRVQLTKDQEFRKKKS